MTTPTLTREDTGEFLPVRVADDTPPLLAALQKEREGKPVATWDQFDEGLTELRRRLIDGLGEADAVLGVGEVQRTLTAMPELPAEPEPTPEQWTEFLKGADERAKLPKKRDDMAELQRRVDTYMAAVDPDPRPGRWVNVAEDDLLPARIVRVGRNPLEQAYAEREARGWKPDPADYGPRPADHGPVDRWLERTEQRLRQSSFGRWLGERFTPVKEER